ncbi:MAG: glycogen debranching N-terminal domain-containing protein [Propionibacteriaceae bacterium]
MSDPRPPFLHHLVTTFAAPTTSLAGPDGDIGRTPGPGFDLDASAEGVWHADVRVLSEVLLAVDGATPEPLADALGPGATHFTAVSRHGPHPFGPEGALRVDRVRRVDPGLLEESVTITNPLDSDITVRLAITLRSDFAPITTVRQGLPVEPVPLDRVPEGHSLEWHHEDVSVHLFAEGARIGIAPDQLRVQLDWDLPVPARGAAAIAWSARITDPGGAVTAAPTTGQPTVTATLQAATDGAVPDPRMARWLSQSLADLDGLRMCLPDHPEDTFFAAGSPWYFTLFGRDSLWTSRLLLPVDVGQAGGTLHTLARLQGQRVDLDTAEEPGKIMHELRRSTSDLGGMSLPPLYYGTIDATPLWICLLHDAWRAGLPTAEVRALLPNLEAALGWLANHGDADGDGFLEYTDTSGHGLVNQGWKDSADSVRFADGRIAEGPVALCEVQGYAYEAARGGADLLDHFGLDGAAGWRQWATDLATRFREQYWCGTGTDRYPALALDGTKQRVDSVTSNIGHLLGTGLLDAAEEALVAHRVSAADLDSGLGLRTLSAGSGGYQPLSYHCGSVWPHDTAIVIAGLHRAGHGDLAAGLSAGLLETATRFGYRLPELWSGEGAPGVPYPTACRPQAWSAAAAITVATRGGTQPPRG